MRLSLKVGPKAPVSGERLLVALRAGLEGVVVVALVAHVDIGRGVLVALDGRHRVRIVADGAGREVVRVLRVVREKAVRVDDIAVNLEFDVDGKELFKRTVAGKTFLFLTGIFRRGRRRG